MVKRWSSILVVFFSILNGFSQSDSLDQKMSFDFGFTRGKNVELWPLVRKYKDADVKETQVLFSIYSQTINYKNHRNHVHFYPFYSADSAKNYKDVRLFTTYYPNIYHYSKDSISKSYKFLELAPNISCLGITSSQNGLLVDNNLFFFLWYKNDQINNRRKFILFPAYWYWANKKEQNHLLFPIYRYKKQFLANDTITKNTFFPLYWTSTSQKSRSKVFFPILWTKKDSVQKYTVLFPVVWKFEDSLKKSFTLFPFYSHSETKDSVESNQKTNVLGIYTHLKTPKEEQSILFPFYFFKRIPTKEDTTYSHVLFPLYWTIKNKSETNRVLFPVYWFSKDSLSKAQVFFPLLWRFENQKEKSLTLFPFFTHGKSKDSLNPYTYSIVLGSYIRFKKPDLTRNILLPCYFSTTRTTENNVYKAKTLFPIYWYTKNKDLTKHTIFPIYWSTKDSLRNNKIVFPILWKYNTSNYKSFTFFPLFSVGHSTDSLHLVSHFNLAGLYTHTHKKDVFYDITKDYLSPLYWSRTQKYRSDTIYRKVLFPIFWSYKSKFINNKVLFPLVWNYKNERAKSLTVLPFFSYTHVKDSVIGYKRLNIIGVWNRYTSPVDIKTSVFPLYRSKTSFENNGTIYRKNLYPIYWSYKDSSHTRSVIFPIYWHFDSPKFKSQTFFPLFSWGHSKDSSRSLQYYNLFGLFTHISRPTLKKNTLFPIVWSKTRIYSGFSDKRRTIFPIYWSVNNHHFKRKVLFPIIWHSVYCNEKDIRKKTTVFPLYWSKVDNTTNNKILFPLIWKLDDDVSKSFTFFPLFSFGKSKDTTQNFNYVNILGLYTHSQDQKEKRNILFPFYWSRADSTVHNKVVFPLLWKYDNENFKSQTVFPFYSKGKSKDSSEVFQYKNVLGFYTRVLKSDEKRTVLFPFLWKKESPKTSSTLVLPFFYSEKSKDSIKHSTRNLLLIYNYKKTDDVVKTNIFPIYWSEKDSLKNNKTIFPLVWKRENQIYKSFTLFPLVSFGHSKDSAQFARHFMLTPFLGTIKKGEAKTLFLFPLFTNKKSADTTKFNFLYVLLRHKKTKQTSETSFLWPLCHSSKNETNKKFRIAPIVWSAKTDTSNMFSIQPLFYHYKSITEKTFIFSWFLYKSENKLGLSKSNEFLWKVYSRKRFQDGDFETRFLYFFYVNLKKEGRSEQGIFPFYYKKSKTNGDKSTSVLFGFYNHFKQYKPDIEEFYEEERVFWFLRLRSNYNLLKQKGKADNLRKR